VSSQPPSKDELQRQVDEVKQDADVQRALKQATPAKKTEAPVRARDKFFIATHLGLLIGLGVLYQVLKSQFPGFVGKYPLTLKLILAISVVVVCLMVLRLIDVYFM